MNTDDILEQMKELGLEPDRPKARALIEIVRRGATPGGSEYARALLDLATSNEAFASDQQGVSVGLRPSLRLGLSPALDR